MIPTCRKAYVIASTTKWFRYVVCGCMILTGALYIWQVNVSTSQGYVMRDIEKNIENLEHENEQLQQQIASLRSVDSVMTRTQMLGLVPLEEVFYMPSDESMAVNR